MRRLTVLAPAAMAAATLLAVSPVAAAAPETPRHDAYIEIWCDSDPFNADGTGGTSVTPGDASAEADKEDDVLAKRVDDRAVQLEKNPGGKDTATERYNLVAGVVQGWFCAEM